ncbi:MAG: polysaccharide biosynthesis/export family protein [Acidobacteria bacterium]|nr:polysaccharide biosynthesis/export family protein [Acidobacteriota bacterium]
MKFWYRGHCFSKLSCLILVVLVTASVGMVLAQVPVVSTTKQPGAVPPRTAPQAEAQSDMAVDDRYRIGPGDLLEIRVFNRPQLSLESARVDARGMIRMPLIEEDLQAACRTESDLSKEIAAGYRKYQRNPQVFVFIKEYNSQPVAVIGAVDKPGRFQLQRRVRLLEMISLVGGPTEKAGTRVQVAHMGNGLICDSSGKLTTNQEGLGDFEVYGLAETLQGGYKSNPYLQPGDVITVPEADQAFVVGNVLKPSPVMLKMPTTISQAIAMAGGVLPDSNLNRIRIIRQEPGARRKSELFVSLTAINQKQTEDPLLQSGDIVDVATLSGRKFMRSLLGGAGPTLASLPLYVFR